MTRRAHGEGSIYQRKDGKWCASIRFEDERTGERDRVTFYGRTKTEARNKLKAAVARLEDGAPVRDASSTLGAWLAEWRESTLQASSRAESTKVTYSHLCRKHLEPAPFGAVPLGRLRASDVDRLILRLRGEGLSSSTVRQTYTILRQALNDARRDGLIARNVAESVKRPTVESKEARFLSPAEVSRLLQAAESSRYHPLLAFIAGTGVRKGEALATRWSDVDLEACTYRVRGTKTEKSRRVLPLSSELVKLLKTQKRTQAAERLRAANIWQDHRAWCSRLRPAHRSARETSSERSTRPLSAPDLRTCVSTPYGTPQPRHGSRTASTSKPCRPCLDTRISRSPPTPTGT